MTIPAANGDAAIPLTFWPCERAKAVVHIIHGLAEYGTRYDRLAQALNAAGYAVYAHDHPGHGRNIETAAAPGDLGAAGWQGLLDNAAAVMTHIKAEHPDLPLAVFGHSMGSFCLQCLLPSLSGQMDAAILSGSSDLELMAQATAANPPAEGETLFAVFNAAFAPNRTDFDWLSRDDAEVDAYIADPWCGYDAPDATGAAIFDAVPIVADIEARKGIRSELPLLLLAGDKDPLNGNGALIHSLAHKYSEAGVAQVDIQLYADGRHEMVNETNRDEVTSALIGWLDKAST